jgi:acetyltransferase-like isoleucine patch superfamily enzyme
MKKGRYYFSKYKLIILFVTKIFKHTPGYVKKVIWDYFLNYEGPISLGLRYCLLSSMVNKCGDNVFVGRGVSIKNAENLIIGNNVSIHSLCYIDAFGGVEIGDNVSIAHQCSIISFDHQWSDVDVPIKYNKTVQLRIKIADDVWIGCGVRVLGGTTIGQRSVIAAGAIVKGDLDGKFLYGGMPAKVIKKLI